MLLATVTLTGLLVAEAHARQAPVTGSSRIKAFLDCSASDCYDDYLREAVDLVEYVRDRTDADVHVLITSAETGARGEEYTLAFIGQKAFASISRTLKVTSDASDSEDCVRRALATALTVGLLPYVAPDTIPAGLAVEADLAGPWLRPPPRHPIRGTGGFSASTATRHWRRKNPRANASGACRSAPTASRPNGS